jgi:hypothetical protein
MMENPKQWLGKIVNITLLYTESKVPYQSFFFSLAIVEGDFYSNTGLVCSLAPQTTSLVLEDGKAMISAYGLGPVYFHGRGAFEPNKPEKLAKCPATARSSRLHDRVGALLAVCCSKHDIKPMI